MRTRIKDIAERVGVSTALVSMYLNDHPLARMAEDTKRKIDEAVREMNYQPSVTARSLKKGKSKTLGLVIADIASVYSGFSSEMLLDEADKHGYQLLISVTRFNKEKEQKCLQNLMNRQADGIIYTLDFDPEKPLPDYVRNYPLLLTTEHPGLLPMFPRCVCDACEKGYPQCPFCDCRRPDADRSCEEVRDRMRRCSGFHPVRIGSANPCRCAGPEGVSLLFVQHRCEKIPDLLLQQ